MADQDGQGKESQNGSQAEGEAQEKDERQEEPQTFEAWLAANDPEGAVKALHDAEVGNLKKALQSERENNKKLSSSLRDAAKNAEGDLKAKLEALADERDAAVQRAEFYALAAAAGCTNIDAAYHIAKGEGAFDNHGRPNIEAVRAKVPELFGQQRAGTAKAGSGTGGTPRPTPSMNDLIRQAAGRG